MDRAARFIANPYPVYRRLQARDPVHWDGSSWVVTRYADVVAGLRDPRLSSARFGTTGGAPSDAPTDGSLLARHFSRWMLYADPPMHTRLRAHAQRAFTPRVVERLRPRIQQLVDDLLDAVQEQRHLDVIMDLAYPLPTIVIAELLGVPVQDRDAFRRWSMAIARYLGNQYDAAYAEQAHHSLDALVDYLRAVIARRLGAPSDDLLSQLVAAPRELAPLAEDEVVAFCTMLLLAGHETTTNLIGNSMLTLLQHPAQAQQLRDDPVLIGPAVEELLRYESPAQIAWRRATLDLELGGKAISAGQTVLLILGAANRDPAQFADPDRLVLERRDNRHLAFGLGAHFCLGAPLARLEGQIAISTLLRRWPTLQLATDRLAWRPNLAFRGLTALPARF